VPARIVEHDGGGTDTDQQCVGFAGVAGQRAGDGDQKKWVELAVRRQCETVECGGDKRRTDRYIGQAWIKVHHGEASSVGDEAQLADREIHLKAIKVLASSFRTHAAPL
jgi:hypothetical protein